MLSVLNSAVSDVSFPSSTDVDAIVSTSMDMSVIWLIRIDYLAKGNIFCQNGKYILKNVTFHVRYNVPECKCHQKC